MCIIKTARQGWPGTPQTAYLTYKPFAIIQLCYLSGLSELQSHLSVFHTLFHVVDICTGCSPFGRATEHFLSQR